MTYFFMLVSVFLIAMELHGLAQRDKEVPTKVRLYASAIFAALVTFLFHNLI